MNPNPNKETPPVNKYGISYALLRKEVQVGRLNKAKNMFLEDKEYQTNEALYAVCQLVIDKFEGKGQLRVGKKVFEITVVERKANND